MPRVGRPARPGSARPDSSRLRARPTIVLVTCACTRLVVADTDGQHDPAVVSGVRRSVGLWFGTTGVGALTMSNRSGSDDGRRAIDGAASGSDLGGAGTGALEGTEGDPVRRVVHLLLGLYLLPAVVVVLAVGGVLIAVEAGVRFLGGAWRRSSRAWRRRDDLAAPLPVPSRPTAVARFRTSGAAPEARTRRPGSVRSHE
jgi:hypothetical protein